VGGDNVGPVPSWVGRHVGRLALERARRSDRNSPSIAFRSAGIRLASGLLARWARLATAAHSIPSPIASLSAGRGRSSRAPKTLVATRWAPRSRRAHDARSSSQIPGFESPWGHSLWRSRRSLWPCPGLHCSPEEPPAGVLLRPAAFYLEMERGPRRGLVGSRSGSAGPLGTRRTATTARPASRSMTTPSTHRRIAAWRSSGSSERSRSGRR
jgi:hypothetical protein